MNINASKSSALSFTRGRVKEPLRYLLRDQVIPEASSCKYLGLVLCSDLSWADQVNYMVEKKPGRHFILQSVFLKGK
jgi:hypothetical protein